MNNGYIIFPKSIKNSWIYPDKKKLGWFTTILMNVNYSEQEYFVGTVKIIVKPNQSVKNLNSWASDFNTSKKTAGLFFQKLHDTGFIKYERLGVGTKSGIIITVLTERSTEIKTPVKKQPSTKKQEENPVDAFKRYPEYDTPEIVLAMKEWRESVKKSYKAPNTKKAWLTALSKMREAKLNKDQALKCINSSYESGYRGLFPSNLKSNNNQVISKQVEQTKEVSDFEGEMNL